MKNIDIETILSNHTTVSSATLDMDLVQKSIDRLKRDMEKNLEWKMMPMYGFKIVEPPKHLFIGNQGVA